MTGGETPKRRRLGVPGAVIALALLGFAGWLIFHRPAPPPPPAEEIEAEAPPPPGPAVRPRPPVAVKAPPPKGPASLEYMDDGVPIMPAHDEDPRPNVPVHPHPITPEHKRIFRENALLYQLNEAMDGRESARLRGLLEEYRDEYPEDPHTMQEGYALIADCIEHPSEQTRAAARVYYDEQTASTLRRFVMRHCLQGNP